MPALRRRARILPASGHLLLPSDGHLHAERGQLAEVNNRTRTSRTSHRRNQPSHSSAAASDDAWPLGGEGVTNQSDSIVPSLRIEAHVSILGIEQSVWIIVRVLRIHMTVVVRHTESH